jgi:hypothetical protein
MGQGHVGVASISGIRNSKTNEWETKSIEVALRDKDGSVKGKIKVL